MSTNLHSKILTILISALVLPMALFAQWASPVNLSPNSVSAVLNESMGSCIGVSGNNTIHVVWTDRQSSTKGAIFYTRSQDAGLTWSAPVSITSLNGNAWNSAIAVNGSSVHVVWREIDTITNKRNSHYIHSLDGGNTWGPNILLDTAVADWPAVTVSGNNVYVANDIVTSASPNNTEIFFLRSTDNGVTWSKHQQITFATGRSEDEAITAEGAHVFMSWNDNRNGKMQIFYKHSGDYGVTWGPDVLINSEASYGTMVSADGANIDVPSAGAPSGFYQIHLNQSADTGVTWGADKNLTHDSLHTYYYPYMVRNGSDLHVTYVESGVGGVYLHSGNGGSTWNAPFTFSPGNIGITPFVAYTGCVLHIIYSSAGHIYYLRNATGNAGHCGTVASLSTGMVAAALCTGAAVNVPYTANGVFNAGNIFTAQLSNASGSFAAAVNIGSVTATASGTIIATIPANTPTGSAYRIRIVSSNPVVTGSDNGSNISISSSPVASISANGSTTFCSGGSVTLNANTGAGLTYQWMLGAGKISGATSGSYTANAAGNYTCVVTNACGSVASNSISVVVNTVQPASITASGPITFCTGGSVMLTANTGLTYQWKLNGANISGGTSSSYSAVAAGSYTCLVTYGCGSSTSNTISVIVNSLPTASISPSGTVICPGHPVILRANTGAGLTYQWRLFGVSIGGATSSVDTAKMAGTYSCIVSNSCGSTTSAAISFTLGVIPSTPGAISISGGGAAVCPGDVRSFSVPAMTGVLFYWTAPAGATITGGQGTKSINVLFTSGFTAAGTLSVIATTSCGSSTASTLAISRNLPATPGVITGATSVCAADTQAYSITAIAGAISYIWAAPSGATIQAGQGTTGVHVVWGTANGYISVFATNNCGNSGTAYLPVNVTCPPAKSGLLAGVVDNSADNNSVLIYPNPATDEITVQISGGQNKITELMLCNTLGQIVINHKFVEDNFGRVTLPLHSVAAGIYFLTVQTGEKAVTQKIIKQ